MCTILVSNEKIYISTYYLLLNCRNQGNPSFKNTTEHLTFFACTLDAHLISKTMEFLYIILLLWNHLDCRPVAFVFWSNYSFLYFFLAEKLDMRNIFFMYLVKVLSIYKINP